MNPLVRYRIRTNTGKELAEANTCGMLCSATHYVPSKNKL